MLKSLKEFGEATVQAYCSDWTVLLLVYWASQSPVQASYAWIFKPIVWAVKIFKTLVG